MASSIIRLIMQRAIANMQKIFRNRHKIGKKIGETAAEMALKEIVKYVMVNGRRIDLTEVDRIYIDHDGSINHDGHGHCVAVIYEGSDGNHYKHTADRWYSWDGQDWV